MVNYEEIKKLMLCFVRCECFINYNMEFIAHRKANEYFRLENCETELDLKCKVLEWLSRGAHKTEPFASRKRNEEFHREMREGINRYLGTNFSHEDLSIIYSSLGNRVNHELTKRFIESGYDLNVIRRTEDG